MAHILALFKNKLMSYKYFINYLRRHKFETKSICVLVPNFIQNSKFTHLTNSLKIAENFLFAMNKSPTKLLFIQYTTGKKMCNRSEASPDSQIDQIGPISHNVNLVMV